MKGNKVYIDYTRLERKRVLFKTLSDGAFFAWADDETERAVQRVSDTRGNVYCVDVSTGTLSSAGNIQGEQSVLELVARISLSYADELLLCQGCTTMPCQCPDA